MHTYYLYIKYMLIYTICDTRYCHPNIYLHKKLLGNPSGISIINQIIKKIENSNRKNVATFIHEFISSVFHSVLEIIFSIILWSARWIKPALEL
jgi:hypothetical protein